MGLFRMADRGTLFLDEVGEIPSHVQAKLLRALQHKEVRPVGAGAAVAVDIRVVSATHRDLASMVKHGGFRTDLFYRLNVVRIEIPPLRERREDISPLSERFLHRFAAEMGKDVLTFTADAVRALERYDYPGNVRELENIVERAVALAGLRSIGIGDLPAVVGGAASAPMPSLGDLPEQGLELDELLGEVERRLLVQALERSGGVRKNAAKLLGITFRSLRYRLAKHALDNDAPESGELDEGD